MLELAAFYKSDELDQDLTHRLMIGDRDEDEQAAIAAGFDFMSAEEFRRLNFNQSEDLNAK